MNVEFRVPGSGLEVSHEGDRVQGSGLGVHMSSLEALEALGVWGVVGPAG